MQIKNTRKEIETLSREEYVLIKDTANNSYKAGTRVRLITGIQGSKKLGHHFSECEGFVTVCRSDAPTAEYFGVHKDKLVRLRDQETFLYEMWKGDRVVDYFWFTVDQARQFVYEGNGDLRPFSHNAPEVFSEAA